MAEIKYQYAYDEVGNLVHIDSVDKEFRASHVFFCVGCGAEMVARLGTYAIDVFMKLCFYEKRF